MRGLRTACVVLTAAATLAVPAAALGQAAHASTVKVIRPNIAGPIAYYNCPPFPAWCKRTLRKGHGDFPGVTITHLRVHLASGHGPVQDLYKVSWKLNDPYVHLNANPLNTPTMNSSRTEEIPLGTISRWAGWAAPAGFTAAINGDYFSYDWSTGNGIPSGMLVHNRQILSFGWGGPAAAFPNSGAMKIASPQAVPTRMTVPGTSVSVLVGVRAFIVLNGPAFADQTANMQGDQVAVYTQQNQQLTIPPGYDGFVVGTAATPTPFRGMLTGAKRIVNQNGVGEIESGFHFAVPNAAPTSVLLPIDNVSNPGCADYVCGPGAQLTLLSGRSMLVAKVGGAADAGLTALAQGSSHAVGVPLDAAGWGGITEVMGGKPQLVKSGETLYPTPWRNPPMMSSDCWQWCYQHWRPALAISRQGYGWMVITGGSNQTGVYGWDWGKILVQLGAESAIGFDNNSSTEIDVPGTGMYSFLPGWQRDIAEATSLSYHS